MYFINLRGKKIKLINSSKYLINWKASSRSKFQFKIKELLFPIWQGHVVFEEFPIIGTRMTLDFFNANLRLAIEVDGDQHVKYNKHFHSKSRLNFIKQLDRDRQKGKFCDLNRIKLVRIYSSDNVENTDLLDSFIKNYE